MAAVGGSIRRKIMLVVLATTVVALVVTGAGLLAYEARALRDAHISDLRTQAQILGRASVPALAFGDRPAAEQDLRMLSAREDITGAAIYDAKGALFAQYVQAGASAPPSKAAPAGYRVEGDVLLMFHPVVEQGETVGMVFLSGRTGMEERVLGYLAILASVMALALGIAWLVSAWLQRSITVPVERVAAAAREVVERRDYSVRAVKTSEDEIGVLADAINRMLADLEREIGERREAEDALRLADRRKDEFLATLAHELRNPLAPIRNSLWLIQRGKQDARVLGEAHAIIERQVNQMVRLVDDLLDVSRITTGKLSLRRERVDLREVARSALEAIEPLARARGVELTFSLPHGPAPINADATRLAQVFVNLLSNAVKFTDRGGKVAFEASLEGGDLRARVADTGIGISPQVLRQLFQIFGQADRSLERTTGGLGVGLWLSRRLVELHGGTLVGASAGEARGAEFVVRIPGMAVAPDSSPTPHAEAQAAPVAGHRLVLVADDNRDFANSLAALLRGLGEEAHVAYDGAGALEAAQRLRPEVAFLDIGMPKMNGYELARRLRAAPATAHMLLVAVTGWGQPADRERAREAGFDEHMVKPVEPERIRAVLRGRERA